jgi:hypothetical protein
MGDDSTPLDSRTEAGNDGARDDGHNAHDGAELPQVVVANVVVEEAANAERKSATDQQVQHPSHFLFISAISFFYLYHFL